MKGLTGRRLRNGMEKYRVNYEASKGLARGSEFGFLVRDKIVADVRGNGTDVISVQSS